MDNLSQIYYLTMESIGTISNDQMGEHLRKIGSVSHLDLPRIFSEFAVKPVSVIENAIVERFNINIKGSNNAFIDIHEVEGKLCYAKIFFLFGLHQLIKISSSEKKINSLMNENIGPPNMEASLTMRGVILEKNSLVYNAGSSIVVTNNSITLTQREFQIHIYESSFFRLLFGPYII